MTYRDRNVKLFVGNLPFESNEEDLRAMLHGVGQIRYLIVRRDNVTNKSKGYAHVEFRTEAEAVEAFKRLVGKEIHGRILKVDFCETVYRNKYPELMALATAYRDKPLVSAISEPMYPQVPPMPPPGVPPIPHGNLPPSHPLPPMIPVMHPPPFPPPPPPPQAMMPVPQQYIPPPPPPPPVMHAMPPPPVPPPPQEYYDDYQPELKRHRVEPDVLLENGKVVSKELLYMIKRMSMLDVYNLVKQIDALMTKSPNTARSLLNANASMRSALVHAKLLLGYKDLNFPNLKNVDVASILDYFVIN